MPRAPSSPTAVQVRSTEPQASVAVAARSVIGSGGTGSGEIPVTTAINIAHEHNEKEIGRKLKAYDAGYRNYYDLVTLEGTLKIRNFEKRSARIVIQACITGKPIKASDNGVCSQSTAELRLLQRKGSVRWTVTLEAGRTKTLTYAYERYVPSR